MASFSFEAPTPTVGLPADCALRIRVRRSAIGSVMLIVRASPARLRQARNFAAIGRFPQLGARQAELAIDAARTSGNGTAVALPRSTRIARLLLQFHLSGGALFGSRISSLSSARRLAYLLATLRRRFSRMSIFVLAMG